MNKPLSKMNIIELRNLAVRLGADKNKLYRTSKQAMMIIINDLRNKKGAR